MEKRVESLQEYLKENGVQTLIHYPIPPHKQECYNEWHERSYPVTERIHREELSIPMNQVISGKEAKEVVRVINSFRI